MLIRFLSTLVLAVMIFSACGSDPKTTQTITEEEGSATCVDKEGKVVDAKQCGEYRVTNTTTTGGGGTDVGDVLLYYWLFSSINRPYPPVGSSVNYNDYSRTPAPNRTYRAPTSTGKVTVPAPPKTTNPAPPKTTNPSAPVTPPKTQPSAPKPSAPKPSIPAPRPAPPKPPSMPRTR